MLKGIHAGDSAFLVQLGRVENRVAASNKQVTTGLRVNQAQDDPFAVQSILNYQNQLDQLTQLQTNLNVSKNDAQNADAALQTSSNILNQLLTIASQGSSDLTTPVSRANLAIQAQQLAQQLVGISNTQVGNHYIFGGDSPTTAPYSLNWGIGPTGATSNHGGSTALTGNTLNLTTGGPFVKGTAGTDDQKFALSYINGSGVASALTLTIPASTGGSTLSQVLSALNSQLNGTGVQAKIGTAGDLQFAGSVPFSVRDLKGTSTTLVTNETTPTTLTNAGNYGTAPSNTFTGVSAGQTDTLTFTPASGSPITVSLTNSNAGSLSAAISQINSVTGTYGIFAVQDPSGSKISFQSSQSFSVSENNSGNASPGLYAAANATSSPVVTAPTTAANTATATGLLRDSSGTTQQAGMTASQIFDAPGASIFQAAFSLARALSANNTADVTTALNDLKTGLSHLNQQTVFYGNLEDWIQTATDQSTTQMTSLTQTISSLRDADLPTAITQMTTDQTSLQAAISAHASLSNKTLFDYLG